MSFKDLGKKLHDAIIEDDGKTPAKPSAPTPAVHPAPAFNFPTAPATPMGPGFGTAAAPALDSPFAVPGSAVLDEAVYKKVLDKTNFDNTPVGKTVHKYFDALEDSGLDVNTRFKSAMKQANKLDGITPDQVLATFDSLKAALQAEADTFGKIADTQAQKQVITRQNRIQEIDDQTARLAQERAQLSAELAEEQAKIAHATSQMGLAAQRRSNEIDQQKAQFAALLR